MMSPAHSAPVRKLAVDFDEKKIDAIFADLDQCRLPGATVGIAIDGKPVYRKGFGLASMELPVVLTPNTRMRMASVTKHVTCLTYLLLCEEGKAGVDDPLGKHFPEFHPVTHKVTMRQIMGNVGGIRDGKSIVYFFSGDHCFATSEQILSLWRRLDDVNFAPGSCWTYTNGGFLILTAAIERITGQTFEEVTRQRVFDPIGMYDTLVHRMDKDPVANRSATHLLNAAGRLEKIHIDAPSAGEGGMISTVNDMLRWMVHMNAPTVGNADTWALMKTPQKLTNGMSTHYGFGLATLPYRGAATLSHVGEWRGGNSYMLKVPHAGLDVVVMVNRADVSGATLAYRILDASLPGLEPPGVASSARAVSGTFRSPATGGVIHFFRPSGAGDIAREGQQVWVNGAKVLVAPDDKGVLRPTSFFTFTGQATTPIGTGLALTAVGDPVHPDAIRLSDFGNVDEYQRVESADPPDARKIAGRYRHDASGTEVAIQARDGGARMITAGEFGTVTYDLEGWAPDIWHARDTRMATFNSVLSFDAQGFRSSDFSNRFLPFRRVAGI